MAICKAYIISSILLVGHVLAYPQPQPQQTQPPTDPPPARDGRSRLACEYMLDCYPWVLEECKESRDTGLYIKAYCYDNYCYALCPPIVPGTSPENSTLGSLDHTDLAHETMAISKENRAHTAKAPLPYPMAAATTGSSETGDGQDDVWWSTSLTSPTTKMPLHPTDVASETMTTITRSDGRIITVPVPIPLPTVMPPDDDDDDDDDINGLWQNPALSTRAL